ncbi:glycerol-3-phosphate responsive antiterminator [Leucobacter sp. G161]|uniref:glycerol-3-phosphate responsive antiterminator n=1 Tax=Leucobacter sp. G161 TaxID=663704 RepID=UPI00073C9776|nr:glycerol-3-phosphate responsive antiterminator [Leucobacter sp. G161]KUF06378.1 hypothetical protein AUL38_13190 [Leucobacter sp. G161]
MDPGRRQRLKRLVGLHARPVIASVLDRSHLEAFIDSSAQFCFLAQTDLIELEAAIARIHERPNKAVFVNIDSIVGLAQDRGGVDYLARLGADGLLTTRGSLIPRAQDAGLLTVQKLFITDRSNIQRGVAAVQGSKPDLLQLMPAPVLPFVANHEIMRIRPVIASGFVTDSTEIEAALSHGAVGVSSSSPKLWEYERAS